MDYIKWLKENLDEERFEHSLGVAEKSVELAEKFGLDKENAYLAGLATGVWKDTDEIEANREVDKIFVPSMPIDVRNKKYADWKRAVERSRNWER